MSEIEEGDQAITPEGERADVGFELNEFDSNDWMVYVNGDHSKNKEYKDGELVKVDQPIRVKVSRKCYAESLVALARECGFEVGGLFYKNDIEFDDNPWPQYVYLKPEKMKVKCVYWDDHDLTYQDDLPQIESWLQANAESEYKCKKCRIVQKKRKEGEPIYCAEHDPSINTNCIDESEDVVSETAKAMEEGLTEDSSEPRPEDEEWRDELIYFITSPEKSDYESLQEFGITGFSGSVEGDIARYYTDYINDLESELQDCWENQKEYKAHVAELMEKLQDVRKELFHKESYIQRLRERLNNARRALRSNQERIEEAREYIWKLVFPDGRVSEEFINEMKTDLDKILTPNSDEGGGCGGN